jgi:GNAT superfamily N-acetyltransferase
MKKHEASIATTTNLERAVAVHAQIPEFDSDYIAKKYIEKNVEDKSPYIVIGQIDKNDTAYMIGYNADNSMYLWLNGTAPEWRRHGLFALMLDELSQEAIRRGYKSITVKSYERFAPMLAALKMFGFKRDNAEGEAIYLTKYLED